MAAAPLRPAQGRVTPPHLGAGEAAQGHGDQEPQRLHVRKTLLAIETEPWHDPSLIDIVFLPCPFGFELNVV